jgi:hypothetical protein
MLLATTTPAKNPSSFKKMTAQNYRTIANNIKIAQFRAIPAITLTKD